MALFTLRISFFTAALAIATTARADTPEPGEAYGPCLDDGTCDKGLRCEHGWLDTWVCVVPGCETWQDCVAVDHPVDSEPWCFGPPTNRWCGLDCYGVKCPEGMECIEKGDGVAWCTWPHD